MTRRSSPGIKAFGLVAVVGLFIFGMYSYHDLHTRQRRSEEKADRLRQQHDSISAQLQGDVYYIANIQILPWRF